MGDYKLLSAVKEKFTCSDRNYERLVEIGGLRESCVNTKTQMLTLKKYTYIVLFSLVFG